MPSSVINREATSLTPSTLLNLFIVDASFLGGPTLYFYDGSNNNFKPVTFNGQNYTPWPCKLQGFDIDGKGSLPRPKLTLANLNGFISSYLLQNNNLIGANFIRRRVFARFIDAANFPDNVNPYGVPDPSAAYPDDIFFINRKVIENKEIVEFEVVTTLEIDNVQLPRRQILATVCPFKYRNSSCGYVGAPIADKNNTVFGVGGYGYTLSDKGEWSASTTYNQGDYVYMVSTLPLTKGERLFYVCSTNTTVGATNSPIANPNRWIADACSRSIAGCKLRFFNQPLRFGGFPGTSRAPIIGS